MNWNEYKEQLRRNIRGIPPLQKLQFAIEICGRLLPDYQNFSEINTWGNVNSLKKGLNFCKEFANGNEPETGSIKSSISEIEKNTPD